MSSNFLFIALLSLFILSELMRRLRLQTSFQILFGLSFLALAILNPISLGLFIVQTAFLLLVSNYCNLRNNFWFVFSVLVSSLPLLFLNSHLFPQWMVFLGIPFLFLKSISYLCEVRWERQPPERSGARLLGYFIYFGNVIAGPFLTQSHFTSQIDQSKNIKKRSLLGPLLLILLGLFKKFVLAENMQNYLSVAYSDPLAFQGVPLWLALILSKFYLYYDLSGYTDMARGLSRAFHVKLPQNFQNPLYASNIAEFWRRWHMTVSGWVRTYIFYPLASTKLSNAGIGVLLVLSFIFFGLWHHFTWNFIIYGALQGIFLSLHLKIQKQRIPIHSLIKRTLQWPFFYLFVLCFPAVFFFASSTANAQEIFQNLMSINATKLRDFNLTGRISFVSVSILIILFEVLTHRRDFARSVRWLQKQSLFTRYWLFLAYIIIFLAFADLGGKTNFVYAR